METMVQRFIRYASINTRSNEESASIPSTQSQVDFATNVLVTDLKAIGLDNVFYNEDNGFVIGTLNANTDEPAPSIGFIAHMDTADYNAENITPRIIENYDGNDICLNESEEIYTHVKDFPNLKNYVGKTLVVTDGLTLLGGDGKAGICEIMEALRYLKEHPEIKHGKIMCAFGPDEEIGVGADHFDVSQFPVDFAYTMDGESLGQLEYETFNAASGTVILKGVSVHTGTAKDIMINCGKLAMQFDALLPGAAVPEHTSGREGFFMLMSMETQVDTGKMNYIIRDHDKQLFEAKKHFFEHAAQTLNDIYNREVCEVIVKDQYYNMYDVIKDNMTCVEVAKSAMIKAGITPDCAPIRGGTDGSKISFMGIPTPNIFTGVENLHGRHEFACVDDMKKAVEVIINIVNIEK
ncbi:peptidase T [Veillonella caviae]|uniref:peptidase T n=1 Tax=Veillonella caviae TaxID=248316 RepID=UPI002356C407|nr:peptidase T [Veillonella caviae]